MIPSISYDGVSIQPEKRGERNNNPANIDYNVNNDWIGQVPYSVSQSQDQRFCVFYAPIYGLRAAAIILLKHARENPSYRSIISAWAPPVENNTAAYLFFVCKHCNVADNANISVTSTLQLANLLSAIVGMENGRVIYPYSMIESAVQDAINAN